jgi:hypothetical protein
MRNVVAAIAFAAASVGFAGSAAAMEPKKAAPAQTQRADQPKKICRWLPVTGSNMNQKVCLTAEDWKKAEALSW